MTFKVGILGVGGISYCHGRTIQAVDGAKLAAICDVSADALDRFGSEFCVSQKYTDLEDMLREEELDILIVCTWGSHHAEHCIRSARTGRVRAILCEKPISSTASECAEMAEAAKENGVLLAEAFKFRHHPCHVKAKAIIDQGQIGELMLIRSSFTASVDPKNLVPEYNWRFDPERGGGAVYDLGCYCIHHARYLAGTEPSSVYAEGQYGQNSGVTETVGIQLYFPGQISAQFFVSFRSFGSQQFEVFGTQGKIRMNYAWNNENMPVRLHVRENSGQSKTIKFPSLDQFSYQLQHLCDCLKTGQSHRIPLTNSINNMRVIDGVHASLKTGKSIDLTQASTA